MLGRPLQSCTISEYSLFSYRIQLQQSPRASSALCGLVLRLLKGIQESC